MILELINEQLERFKKTTGCVEMDRWCYISRRKFTGKEYGCQHPMDPSI